MNRCLVYAVGFGGLELDGGDSSVFTAECLSLSSADPSPTGRAVVLGGGVPAATEVG